MMQKDDNGFKEKSERNKVTKEIKHRREKSQAGVCTCVLVCWGWYRGGREISLFLPQLSSAVQELLIESVLIRHASWHHIVQEMIYSFHLFFLSFYFVEGKQWSTKKEEFALLYWECVIVLLWCLFYLTASFILFTLCFGRLWKNEQIHISLMNPKRYFGSFDVTL